MCVCVCVFERERVCVIKCQCVGLDPCITQRHRQTDTHTHTHTHTLVTWHRAAQDLRAHADSAAGVPGAWVDADVTGHHGFGEDVEDGNLFLSIRAEYLLRRAGTHTVTWATAEVQSVTGVFVSHQISGAILQHHPAVRVITEQNLIRAHPITPETHTHTHTLIRTSHTL